MQNSTPLPRPVGVSLRCGPWHLRSLFQSPPFPLAVALRTMQPGRGAWLRLALLLVCLHVPPCSARGDPVLHSLADWLANQTLPLPDISVPLPLANTSLTGIRCTDVHVGNISSKYTPHKPVLHLQASHASISCHADWALHGLLGRESGTVHLAVEVLKIGGTIKVYSQGHPPLADSVSLEKCAVTVERVVIDFSKGSLIGKVLHLLKVFDLLHTPPPRPCPSYALVQLSKLQQVWGPY